MIRLLMAVLIASFVGVSSLAVAGNHNSELPPGLQKKVQQGKPLPPGWQKKMDIRSGGRLNQDLYDYGEVRDLGDGRQEVRIEDQIYTVIKDTREIIDILEQ
ncbi:hypothetical protein [Marinobacter sp. CHS3-4]|uniref:hypothetical protein n=1 Tax=Marinobacter sp. CHS3-4 TaxID=3045174 RepID=UPI0024B4DB2C|nr:hypothetical protein [Marinobacter sp. CHS3-4]MDI9243895.1 hypothetical protein [Marinobacter sp. CHS3-4]